MSGFLSLDDRLELIRRAAESASTIAETHNVECGGGFVSDCKLHSEAWNHHNSHAQYDFSKIQYIMLHSEARARAAHI